MHGHRFGFFGVDGLGDQGDQQVIIIQQPQPAPTAEPSKTAENRISSATLGGRRVWSAGLRARILGPFRSKRQSIDITDLPHEPHVNSINNGQTQWSRVLKLKGISILLVLIVSVGAISPQL